MVQEASREPPSIPTLLTKKQVKQKVESLTIQLQFMTSQRNELQDPLILIPEGFFDNRPSHRPNPSYEKLKMEHRQIIPDLQILKSENIEDLQKFSELTKELGFHCD